MTSTATAVRKVTSADAPDHVPAQDPLSKLRAALDALRMKDKKGPAAFAEFERDLHARLMEIERDVVAAEMAKLDVDAPAVVIAGKVHRRVLRQTQTYLTAAGDVVVERTLYKDRADAAGRCVSPMELTLGVVGDFWTPRAAQQALWVVTQMTPGKAAELFDRLGGMTPSKTTLDQLPKRVAARWEGDRDRLEAALRGGLVVPDGAVSITVSLDGVLAPLEDLDVTGARHAAAADGRLTKGPLGYREIGCATVSFCDDQGDLLGAVRFARAPEAHKTALKKSLAAEVTAILARRPALRLMKVADGVADNWAFLTDALPAGDEAIDFFHATEHLHAAIAAAYGDGTRETTFRYETLRDTLRDTVGGVETVIRALAYLATKYPQRDVIRKARNYFRTHRRRMQYATLTAQGLMIGSGVVEAACKTLVTQRLKNSGMRWSADGAQAILTPRGWDQSDRFDEAWALVAAKFHADVTVLANVIALKPKPEARPSGTSR